MFAELIHDNEFWFLLAFLVFIGAMWKTVSKALTTGLDGRAAKVRDELEEARKLREQAQAMFDDYRTKQEAAVKTAAEILDAAKQEAERMRREGEEDLKRSLTSREAQAMDRIAQAEQAAVDAVKTRAVELAIRAATDLIPQVVDKARASALVDQAIDQLPAA